MKNIFLMLTLASILFYCTKIQPKTELITQSQIDETLHDTIVLVALLKQFENQVVVTNKIAFNTLRKHFTSKEYLILIGNQ